MSKFNKIISIILVTIMIGLIPINTNNVKAYENEEIQIKSASATGLLEEILLYIIYSFHQIYNIYSLYRKLLIVHTL